MDIYVKKPKPTVLNSTQPTLTTDGGSNPGIAPLITMIAVLAIILIFCFCGAPAVREFCRKKVCCCCPEPLDEAEQLDNRRQSVRSRRRTQPDDELVTITSVENTKNGEVPQSNIQDPAHQQ